MKARMLDVSTRFGFPCRGFLPEMETFNVIRFAEIPDAVEAADVVAFGGGADIATELYSNRPMVPGAVERMSPRDLFEVEVFREAVKQDKPLLGICRGSQFLCAMAGGALVQDVTGHSGLHALETFDATPSLNITSTHHQMMYLLGLDKDVYKLLAWTPKRSRTYTRDKMRCREEQEVDPEVVFFKKIRALAIQGHPEYMNQNDNVIKWLKSQFYSFFEELK